MRFGFTLLLLLLLLSGFGQSTENEHLEKKAHSPRKATLYSTFLPGAGQVYNRAYWKVPIIYGGFAAFTYFIHFNNMEYLKWRSLYEQKVNETIDDLYEGVNEETLRREREKWRRSRDLNYIGLGFLYLLQIMDATVEAHLFEYDISDDLTLRYQPFIYQNTWTSNQQSGAGNIGLGVSLSF
ncbi:MAG: DUF5683 domain-containing protein [Salinivirgaceae bacterium]|jgi:hypothetical protein|nr:DUF5683 domain-containing protein [Salinivirgaceae bacterium]